MLGSVKRNIQQIKSEVFTLRQGSQFTFCGDSASCAVPLDEEKEPHSFPGRKHIRNRTKLGRLKQVQFEKNINTDEDNKYFQTQDFKENTHGQRRYSSTANSDNINDHINKYTENVNNQNNYLTKSYSIHSCTRGELKKPFHESPSNSLKNNYLVQNINNFNLCKDEHRDYMHCVLNGIPFQKETQDHNYRAKSAVVKTSNCIENNARIKPSTSGNLLFGIENKSRNKSDLNDGFIAGDTSINCDDSRKDFGISSTKLFENGNSHETNHVTLKQSTPLKIKYQPKFKNSSVSFNQQSLDVPKTYETVNANRNTEVKIAGNSQNIIYEERNLNNVNANVAEAQKNINRQNESDKDSKYPDNSIDNHFDVSFPGITHPALCTTRNLSQEQSQSPAENGETKLNNNKCSNDKFTKKSVPDLSKQTVTTKAAQALAMMKKLNTTAMGVDSPRTEYLLNTKDKNTIFQTNNNIYTSTKNSKGVNTVKRTPTNDNYDGLTKLLAEHKHQLEHLLDRVARMKDVHPKKTQQATDEQIKPVFNEAGCKLKSVEKMKRLSPSVSFVKKPSYPAEDSKTNATFPTLQSLKANKNVSVRNSDVQMGDQIKQNLPQSKISSFNKDKRLSNCEFKTFIGESKKENHIVPIISTINFGKKNNYRDSDVYIGDQIKLSKITPWSSQKQEKELSEIEISNEDQQNENQSIYFSENKKKLLSEDTGTISQKDMAPTLSHTHVEDFIKKTLPLPSFSYEKKELQMRFENVDKSKDFQPVEIAMPLPSLQDEERRLLSRDSDIPVGDQIGMNDSIEGVTKFPQNVVTLQTSPSKLHVNNKNGTATLDGSKLAHCNYSPLKQILSQYTFKKKRLNLNPVTEELAWGRPSPGEQKTRSTSSMKGKLPTMSYSSYLKNNKKNLESSTYMNDHPEKKVASQARAYKFINSKDYNIREKIKNKNSLFKNIHKTNKMSTASINFKNKKKWKKDENKEKNDSITKLWQDTSHSVKLSKGVYMGNFKKDFNKSSSKFTKVKLKSNYLSHFASLSHCQKDKHKEKQQNMLQDTFNIVATPSTLKSSSSTFKNSSKSWNEFPSPIISGPSWNQLADSEYGFSCSQWNLHGRQEKIKIDYKPVKQKQRPIEQNARQTIDHLTSLSKKLVTSSSDTSNAWWKKASNVQGMKSPAFSLPWSNTSTNFKDKTSVGSVKKRSSNPVVAGRLLSTSTLSDELKLDDSKESSHINSLIRKDDPSSKLHTNQRQIEIFENVPQQLTNSELPRSFDTHSVSKADKGTNSSLKESITNNFTAFKKILNRQDQNFLDGHSFKHSWTDLKNAVYKIIKEQSSNCVYCTSSPNIVTVTSNIAKENEYPDNTSTKNNFKEDIDENEQSKKQRCKELSMMYGRSFNSYVVRNSSANPSKQIAPKFLEGAINY